MAIFIHNINVSTAWSSINKQMFYRVQLQSYSFSSRIHTQTHIHLIRFARPFVRCTLLFGTATFLVSHKPLHQIRIHIHIISLSILAYHCQSHSALVLFLFPFRCPSPLLSFFFSISLSRFFLRLNRTPSLKWHGHRSDEQKCGMNDSIG